MLRRLIHERIRSSSEKSWKTQTEDILLFMQTTSPTCPSRRTFFLRSGLRSKPFTHLVHIVSHTFHTFFRCPLWEGKKWTSVPLLATDGEGSVKEVCAWTWIEGVR